jgi:hypothetical protein
MVGSVSGNVGEGSAAFVVVVGTRASGVATPHLHSHHFLFSFSMMLAHDDPHARSSAWQQPQPPVVRSLTQRTVNTVLQLCVLVGSRAAEGDPPFAVPSKLRRGEFTAIEDDTMSRRKADEKSRRSTSRPR